VPVVLAPAEVLAGLIAICVLFAAYLIAQIVSAVFNAVPIPIIGGKIADAFTWLAQNVLTAMGWLWSKTNPIAVWTAMTNILHDTEQGLHTVLFGDVLGSLQWLYHTAIPAAANWAVATVHAVLDPFMAGVNGFIGGVLGFITWVHAQLAGLWNAVSVALPGQIGLAVRGVEGELHAAESAILGDLAAAEATAAHALASAIAGIESWTTGQIGTAVGGIERDLGAVRDLVTGIAIPELIALSKVVTTVAGDVARVDECVGGICSTGSGNILGDIGKILQQLAPLFDAGLLLALVGAAARDPAGVADEIESVFAPIVQDASEAFATVTGIKVAA
jgi:hypothetical protein